MRRQFLILVLCLLIGCEKSLQVNVPSQAPQLVINGQWQQGQLFQLRVTRSRGITDPVDTGSTLIRTYEVKDAHVTVLQNGVAVDSLFYDSLNFRYVNSRNKTVIGAGYEVHATRTGLPDAVVASPAILATVPVIAPAIVHNAGFNTAGQATATISFSFTDNGSTKDYYLLRVHKSDGSYANCVDTRDQDFEKLVFNNPFNTDPCIDGNKLLLGDSNFNGQTKKIVLFVAESQMANRTANNRLQRPYVDILHISRDLFLFVRGSNNYDVSKDNPYAEPINLYSNVRGGYGFFTTYSIYTDTLR